jgi:hypothetical protein
MLDLISFSCQILFTILGLAALFSFSDHPFLIPLSFCCISLSVIQRIEFSSVYISIIIVSIFRSPSLVQFISLFLGLALSFGILIGVDRTIELPHLAFDSTPKTIFLSLLNSDSGYLVRISSILIVILCFLHHQHEPILVLVSMLTGAVVSLWLPVVSMADGDRSVVAVIHFFVLSALGIAVKNQPRKRLGIGCLFGLALIAIVTRRTEFVAFVRKCILERGNWI